jgi:hypothetical protein
VYASLRRARRIGYGLGRSGPLDQLSDIARFTLEHYSKNSASRLVTTGLKSGGRDVMVTRRLPGRAACPFPPRGMSGPALAVCAPDAAVAASARHSQLPPVISGHHPVRPERIPARPTVPGSFFRRQRRPEPVTDLFLPLTRLELLVLAAKLREGRISARRSVLRCRSLPAAWNMIRLSSSIADLEDEVSQALAGY